MSWEESLEVDLGELKWLVERLGEEREREARAIRNANRKR
jgi:hypothetical protein